MCLACLVNLREFYNKKNTKQVEFKIPKAVSVKIHQLSGIRFICEFAKLRQASGCPFAWNHFDYNREGFHEIFIGDFH
jgi:hypothetical protein